MASTNLSDEAGVKGSTTMPIGTGNTEAMLPIEVDSEDPENMDFDKLSIYPSMNFSSIPRPYDLESMYVRITLQTD